MSGTCLDKWPNIWPRQSRLLLWAFEVQYWLPPGGQSCHQVPGWNMEWNCSSVCRWVVVVAAVMIIMLTFSYWNLPYSSQGEEWEKYSHQRVKRVRREVQLLQRVCAGGGETQPLHGGELECGGVACLCK